MKEKKHKKGLLIAVLAAAAVAVAVFVVVLFTLLMPNIHYQHAVTLMESGNYDEAIEVFEAMDGYRDSTAQIENCQTALKDIDYDAAVALMDAGEYTDAITAFEAMDGYRDSAAQIENCRTALKDIDYDAAVTLMDAGEYTDAIAAFEAMDGYRDSAEMISEIYHMPEYLSTLEVGENFYFGNYAGEEIEWRVLAKEDNEILVISEYGLDAQPYNTVDAGVTWETCTLRSWLNNDFYNDAFTAEEQSMIQTTSVVNDNIPNYSMNAGNNTQDKVFLLSSDEAERYFESDDDRMCIPTEYAMANGAYIDEEYSEKYGEIVNTSWWWLRSPYDGGIIAVSVDERGLLRDSNYGGPVVDSPDCVRPAFWLNLDS